MRLESEAEVHVSANEALQLGVIGVGSMALVLTLAFALLGGETTFATSGSIQEASKLVVACLAATMAAYLAVTLKPRPRSSRIVATQDGLAIDGRAAIPASHLQKLQVLPSSDRWAVEIPRRTSLLRLVFSTRGDAERFAGALVGRDRLPAAVLRVRRKASYYVFVATISLWIVVYGALCALPGVPLLGTLLLGLLLPPALWVTLRALPSQIILREDGVAFLHPLGRTFLRREEIEKLVVADDDCLEVVLADGGSLRLPDLVNHPRDDGAHTRSASPAERLALAFEDFAT